MSQKSCNPVEESNDFTVSETDSDQEPFTIDRIEELINELTLKSSNHELVDKK